MDREALSEREYGMGLGPGRSQCGMEIGCGLYVSRRHRCCYHRPSGPAKDGDEVMAQAICTPHGENRGEKETGLEGGGGGKKIMKTESSVSSGVGFALFFVG